jgi:hypothetical protein
MPELSGSTYSELDASNNQAAPNGMPEGMPPSGVNDSWRAAMGAIKRSYDRDHAGSWCTVGGTANAISLTYAVAPSSYVQGEKYAFKATAANSGATTINVNGLGAKNVYKKSPSGAASACTGGEIQSGDLVELEYDGTQFQLLSNAAFAGGMLTATTTMSGAAFNESYVSSAQAVVATVLDISGIAANFIDLSQSLGANITGFGTLPAGTERTLRFVGATPGNLVNGSIALPAANTIVIGQYDIIKIRSFGGGAWQLVSYMRYGSAPIYGAASAATTLAGTDTTQFLTAVGFAGNKSLAGNGYYKFPGGLVIQWGAVAVGGSSTSTVTFPTAFPATLLSVVVTYITTAPPANSCTAQAISNGQMTVANGSSNPQSIYWMAIGV